MTQAKGEKMKPTKYSWTQDAIRYNELEKTVQDELRNGSSLNSLEIMKKHNTSRLVDAISAEARERLKNEKDM